MVAYVRWLVVAVVDVLTKELGTYELDFEKISSRDPKSFC